MNKKQAALDLEQERRLQAMEARYDTYHGKEFDARVRWFGEEAVQLEDDSTWSAWHW